MVRPRTSAPPDGSGRLAERHERDGALADDGGADGLQQRQDDLDVLPLLDGSF